MLNLEANSNVWGITGNLGGGKSLTAVSIAVSALGRGFFVCSNITLNAKNISRYLGFDVQPLILQFSLDDPNFNAFSLPCGSPRGTRNGKRVLVILDEVAEWLDQYASHSDSRVRNFLSWLRHSSKRSQDVLLVVQRLEFMKKDLRLLVSRWVVVDDMKNYRFPIIKIKFPLFYPFCMQRVFSKTKQLLQGPNFVNKKFFGQFYNTAECLNSDGASSVYEYNKPVFYPNLKFYLFALLFSYFVLFIFLIMNYKFL